MTLELRSHQLALHPVMRAWIEQRARESLSRYAHQLSRVSIRLRDTNGPRGGFDKECRIEVSVLGANAIAIEQRDSEILPLVRGALDRMRFALARSVSRARRWRRRRVS